MNNLSVAERMPLGMPKVEFLPLRKGSLVRQFRLLEDWEYVLPRVGRKPFHIFIPTGFIFDGASIPRIFTAIYSPIGYLLIAALIHDYLYKDCSFIGIEADVHNTRKRHHVTRTRADSMFKQIANIEYPDHKKKTWVAHKFLRVGGWVAWNRHRKAE